MFGPNCTTRLEQRVDGHHREPSFMDLLDGLDEAFRRRLGVGREWDLLFLTGSGTLGVEAAVSSLRRPARGPSDRGEFTRRMRGLMQTHGALDDAAPLSCDVALETSRSDPSCSPDAFLVDAVSSYPYYDLPAAAQVWVTVSSKQLGGAPVLAVVGVHADAWNALHDASRVSYLNLARYRDARKARQTPFTPAMPLFADLLETLGRFDRAELRRRVDSNSDRIVKALGREAFVGATRCPALTIPKRNVRPEVARSFELYGLRTGSDAYHVFTYSEPPERYGELADALAERPADAAEAAPSPAA